MTRSRVWSAECLAVMMLTAGTCLGQTITDTQNILDTILKGYNLDIRPVYIQSEAVRVNISMELVNIKEFDEVSERLTVVGIMYMTWKDRRLSWDPLEHNDTEMITLPVKYIWRPNLFLTTPFGEITPIGGGANDWAVAKVQYDGEVTWSQGDAISSSCNIDITHFPFDEQTCQLSFIPWGFLSNEISLYAAKEKVHQSSYTEHGAWNLVNSRVMAEDISSLSSVLLVELTLKRRPDFFLVNVILPVIFISFLNVIVFFIPVESGERVSYAITTYLALAVFMTMVGDNMPKNSKKMAIICHFLLLNVAHSTLICLETITCIGVYYRKGPVPPWLCNMLTRGSRNTRGRSTKVETVNDPKDILGGNQFDKQRATGADVNYWDETSRLQVDENKVSWQDVCRSMDKCFGMISVLSLVIFLLSFVILVAYSKAYNQ